MLRLIRPNDPPNDLQENTHYVVSSPTVSSVYRAFPGISFEILGGNNQIKLLRSRKLGVNISSWSRLFGSTDYVRRQADLNYLVDDMCAVCDSLNLYYDPRRPASLSSLARDLIRPWLHGIWRPTCGLAGRAAKEAVFGGRMEIYTARGGPGVLYEYDLPSCYPTLLSREIPCSAPWAIPRAEFLQTELIELWRVRVRIKTPTRALGMLPFRSDNDGVIYPAGRWEGVYWGDELHAAIERGASIEPIMGWGFGAANALLEPMAALAKLSANARAIRGAIKSLQVISVGILAQRTRPTEVISGRPEIGDIPLSLEDALWVRTLPGDPQRLPWNREHVASYIWSRARVELLRALERAPRQAIVQSHTDGFISSEEINLLPPPWRIKRRWESLKGWECPYRGALTVDRARIKAPGRPRGMDGD